MPDWINGRLICCGKTGRESSLDVAYGTDCQGRLSLWTFPYIWTAGGIVDHYWMNGMIIIYSQSIAECRHTACHEHGTRDCTVRVCSGYRLPYGLWTGRKCCCPGSILALQRNDQIRTLLVHTSSACLTACLRVWKSFRSGFSTTN